MEPPFTLDTLRGLLDDRVGRVWRHDVDYDAGCALNMARLEHHHGVRAVYCIRARGPYNPFSTELAEILDGIVAYGHRLGVHTDLRLPRNHPTTPELLHNHAENDWRLLSAEYPVSRFVSFHAPPRDIYGKTVAGFEHAFQDNRAAATVSDSRGVWHGNPHTALCLSLHPEWWFWPAAKADRWRELEAAKP